MFCKSETLVYGNDMYVESPHLPPPGLVLVAPWWWSPPPTGPVRSSILTISVWGQHLWTPHRSQIVEHAALVYLFAGPTSLLSFLLNRWMLFLRFPSLFLFWDFLSWPAPPPVKATSDGKQCQESCSCFRSCSCSWKRVRPQKRMARHSIPSLITQEKKG